MLRSEGTSDLGIKKTLYIGAARDRCSGSGDSGRRVDKREITPKGVQEGENRSCPPVLTRAEPVISQPTTQPTKCDVLYDLRGVWQFLRTSKL